MVKRLRRCPLTAESAVRFRMGLPKKREANTSGVGFAFFVAPKRNVRGNGVAVVRIRASESCRGAPACGKRQIPQMITNKKHLESTRQQSCRRSYSRSESCRGIPACGKRQIPQMITNKKHLKSTRQTRFAVVRQFAARQILAEGLPLAGNGKFRMELRYDYKKHLESMRQSVSSSVSLP